MRTNTNAGSLRKLFARRNSRGPAFRCGPFRPTFLTMQISQVCVIGSEGDMLSGLSAVRSEAILEQSGGTYGG